jgi:hypothetical protein
MATKTSAPKPSSGQSNNSISYAPGDREAFGSPTQPSDSGLDTVQPGKDPEKGTGLC